MDSHVLSGLLQGVYAVCAAQHCVVGPALTCWQACLLTCLLLDVRYSPCTKCQRSFGYVVMCWFCKAVCPAQAVMVEVLLLAAYCRRDSARLMVTQRRAWPRHRRPCVQICTKQESRGSKSLQLHMHTSLAVYSCSAVVDLAGCLLPGGPRRADGHTAAVRGLERGGAPRVSGQLPRGRSGVPVVPEPPEPAVPRGALRRHRLRPLPAECAGAHAHRCAHCPQSSCCASSCAMKPRFGRRAASVSWQHRRMCGRTAPAPVPHKPADCR